MSKYFHFVNSIETTKRAVKRKIEIFIEYKTIYIIYQYSINEKWQFWIWNSNECKKYYNNIKIQWCPKQLFQGWILKFAGWKRAVAVDNIEFQNCALAEKRGGRCSRLQTACDNGACIHPDQVCVSRYIDIFIFPSQYFARSLQNYLVS